MYRIVTDFFFHVVGFLYNAYRTHLSMADILLTFSSAVSVPTFVSATLFLGAAGRFFVAGVVAGVPGLVSVNFGSLVCLGGDCRFLSGASPRAGVGSLKLSVLSKASRSESRSEYMVLASIKMSASDRLVPSIDVMVGCSEAFCLVWTCGDIQLLLSTLVWFVIGCCDLGVY